MTGRWEAMGRHAGRRRVPVCVRLGIRRVALDYSDASVGPRLAARQMALGGLACALSSVGGLRPCQIEHNATAIGYTRTSSAANVGEDKDSVTHQRKAIQAYNVRFPIMTAMHLEDARTRIDTHSQGVCSDVIPHMSTRPRARSRRADPAPTCLRIGAALKKHPANPHAQNYGH
jgi:hypothetical protein